MRERTEEEKNKIYVIKLINVAYIYGWKQLYYELKKWVYKL